MSQPTTGPVIITAGLAAWANVPEDDADLVATVDAVNGLVAGLPVAVLSDPDIVEDWPAQVVQGGTMLFKRFWRRRDTPAGVALATDDGSVLAFARSDPDVSMMLQLGAYEKPNRIG